MELIALQCAKCGGPVKHMANATKEYNSKMEEIRKKQEEMYSSNDLDDEEYYNDSYEDDYDDDPYADEYDADDEYDDDEYDY